MYVSCQNRLRESLELFEKIWNNRYVVGVHDMVQCCSMGTRLLCAELVCREVCDTVIGVWFGSVPLQLTHTYVDLLLLSSLGGGFVCCTVVIKRFKP